jgi:hypothetical protein
VSILFKDSSVTRNAVQISMLQDRTDLESPFLSGGAISINFRLLAVNMTVTNSSFVKNEITSTTKTAGVSGGAIELTSSSEKSALTMSNTFFDSNRALGGKIVAAVPRTGLCFGGAVSVRSICSVSMDNMNFTKNICAGGEGGTSGAQAHGGAISVVYPPNTPLSGNGISISNSSFYFNRVLLSFSSGSTELLATGGAIHIDLDTARAVDGIDISDCNFTSNMISSSSSGAGGGLFIRGYQISHFARSVSIARNSFRKNSVGSLSGSAAIASQILQGGAVSLTVTFNGFARVSVVDSVFESNRVKSLKSQTSAGALHLEVSQPESDDPRDRIIISRCNFTQNSSEGPRAFGAAMTLSGVFYATVCDSIWIENELMCEQEGHGSDTPCRGGAVHVFFHEIIAGASSPNSRVSFNNCNFSRNALLNSQCSTVLGGAVSLVTAVYSREVSASFFKCNFDLNVLTGSYSLYVDAVVKSNFFIVQVAAQLAVLSV